VKIYPTSGRVINSDRSTPYPDASDHNMVKATIKGGITTAQVGTFNVRRSDLGDKPPYDWATRDSRAAHLIADSGVSILAVQECEPDQDSYLLKKLPELTDAPWAAVSAPTNVGLMYKTDRWKLATSTQLTMDNGAETDRRLVLGLFRSVKTSEQIWIGSTHFGVGITLAERRRYQARKVCEFLRDLAPYGDVRDSAVIMGDFNDWADWKHAGVRQVFDSFGFSDLPRRLSDAHFDGDSRSTKHAFGKLTPNDGRHIDTIFTRR
jgi:endonuclease/exonuclease/phosphatase family metal-dependent hydrolase